MRWAGGLTIGQLEMSLDSHYIVKKQKQLSKPVFNRSHPKRNSTTPAIAVISSLVGRSAKPWQVRGGQLHSSSWSVGVVLISWQAGPGCRLHWHLHLSLSLSSFSDWVSPLFHPSLRPAASARSAGCWWLTPPPTPPSPPSSPLYFWPTQPPCTWHQLCRQQCEIPAAYILTWPPNDFDWQQMLYYLVIVGL